jgi:hypothetical protein
MRILLAIPTIDRDCKYFDEFYGRLKNAIENFTDEIDVLILTRNQDIEIQERWQQVEDIKIVTFENYEIQERHNLGALVRKRNFAIEYAQLNQYDALWFVDADVGVREDTLIRLVQSIELVLTWSWHRTSLEYMAGLQLVFLEPSTINLY